MSFVIGQRWLSESENELGLGQVSALNARTVTLFFPAVNETRIYASASAPLIRVSFKPGDNITHNSGWQGRVLKVTEQQGCLIYTVERADNQAETLLPESELAARLSFSRPQDRLFNAQIERSEHFALRYQALCHQRAQFQSPLRGLRGTRASLIPHQLYIAREVGQRIAPRVLLADEVGLGKTIEAGMILQQQLFAGRVERALIIVPETLQHQWLVEMLRRFNLPFSLFDEERAADFAATETEAERNPFSSENLIICALDWLLAQPKRAAQAVAAEFDMLIVDEAHHLLWTEQQPSASYQLVENLARHIPSVLLLTATPEQLGQQSHFARLRLLDPARFYDYAAFSAEQRNYQPIARAVQTLLSDNPLSTAEQNALTELLSEQDIEPALKAIRSAADNDLCRQAREELIRDLIDRHGTGRLLFRNTRQGVKGFPSRVYHQIRLTPALSGQDPRIEWLIAFLQRLRTEKVLVICQTLATAVQLEKTLRDKEGIRSALFHEKMSIVERDRAAAYFAQTEQGAQVLLSSGIGSEGRNFQFACHLVLFDLPHNPDLLEQCIGRLDRIGQNREVQIYAPCIADSAQARLAQWYHQGLNAFEETCPMGAVLFEKCGRKLQDFLQRETVGTDFEQFIQDTAKQRLQLKRELEQGRDRLLELNSNGGEQAQLLAAEIAAQDAEQALMDFSLNLFDIIGVEQEDLGEHSVVISPTGTMLVPDFPGLKEEGVTVTFDRRLALAREEIEFLTWDHPMIRNGIDLITSGNIGKAAAALLPNHKLPPGTLLLELVYVAESQAPKGLQLTRFLPPTPVRMLLDGKGNDLAAQVSFHALQKQLKPLDGNLVNKAVKMLRDHIERLLQTGEKYMADQLKPLVEQALRRADSELSAELNRLTALQAVNKNIRQDEIERLQHIRAQSLQRIAQANWRLDSLRVIISNNA